MNFSAPADPAGGWKRKENENARGGR